MGTSTIRKTAVAAVFAVSAAVVPAFADDIAECAKASGDVAIGACSRIIDTGGRDLSPAYYNRGLARYYRGDYDLVISDENEAIRRKPDNAFAYHVRGLAYAAKKDFELAIADYTQAVKIDPKFVTTIFSRAVSYAAKKDYELAIADYTQAIKIDPKYPGASYGRGNVYLAKGDYDRAIADYNDAIKIKPDHADAFLGRGNAYRVKNDYDRAISDYGDALKIKPNYVEVFVNRARIYDIRMDIDRGIADYNEAIRLSPKDASLYRLRSYLLTAKGQSDRAIADLTEAIRIDPAEALTYRDRGIAYREGGNLESALVDFNESIRRDPNQAMTYATRGLAYEKRGDTVRARQDFETAAALPATADPFSSYGLKVATERLAALSTSTPVTAATPAATPTMAVSSSSNDRRVALVIGNSAYRNAPSLPNPQRDAALVANTLKKIGFTTVTLQTDLTKDALVSALRAFAQTAETADWAVVYYAGHGMEVGGTNYLVPIDARIAADRDIAFEAVPLDQVINAAERAKKLRLVILDACRDNPLANQMKRTLTVATRSVSQGLAAVEPEAGTLVVYAAKDGETALDGDGANSPFASAFVKNLQTPNLEVRRLFDFVRDDVMDVTKRKQKPFSYGSISGRQDFYFVAAK